MSETLLPGYTTLGIINNGNNVEHLALEACSAGFIVGIYTPKTSIEVSKISNFSVKGSLNNIEQLKLFIKRCDVITYTGTIVNDQLANLLKEITEVPQGMEILDLIHDRSILNAFLSMIHVNSVPYRTVVDLNDIQRGTNVFGYPTILKPIQTSTLNDRQLVIKNHVDISKAAGMLEIGTYVLEPDLHNDHHFSILMVKSEDGSLGQFPVVETHYHNHQQIRVNACPNLSIQIKQRLEAKAEQVAAHLNYVGGIEISCVCSKSHHIYIEGLRLPFDLVSDLLTFNGINVYQQHLKALIGGEVHSTKSQIAGIVERISHDNYQKVQRLWLHNSGISLHMDQESNAGNVFIKPQMPK